MRSETDLAHLRTLGDLAVRLAACPDQAAVAAEAVSALAELGFAAVYLTAETDLHLAAVSPRGAAPARPQTATPAWPQTAAPAWPEDAALAAPKDATPAATEGTPRAAPEGAAPATRPNPLSAADLPETLPATLFHNAPNGADALVLPLSNGPDLLGALVTGLAPGEFPRLVAEIVAAALRNAARHAEAQRTIAALAELDRVKTDLLTNASRELRTPLTLVSAPAEEALAEPLPPAQRERIRLVRRNAARLRRLLSNILDFTRITSGGLRAEPVATELAGLTRAIAAAFAPAIERGGLEFVVDCPPLNRMAFVDREMWERIVLNLLSNALKFTLDGTITLRLSGDGQDVRLSVTDTGIGIPADQIPLLHRRFHRVQGAVGRTGEGAGIGLALVHELVALHAGTVSVTSTPGAGSTFEVRVPYGTGAPATTTRGPGWVREVHLTEALGWVATDLPEPATTPDGPPVLIVEDNADLRRYLEQLLRPQWTVRTAPDGPAALDAVRAARPALVLADVALPHLDGLELLAALRRDPATEDVPVILLSAQAGGEATAEGLRAGADDYLVKPFSPVELLARVRSSIELARLRHHHSEREAIQARFAAALAGATDVREVLSVAVRELGAPWDAGAVLVVGWEGGDKGRVIAPDAGRSWDSLPRHVREVLDDLRLRTGPAVLAGQAGVAASVDVVGEDVAVWLELPGARPVSSVDRNLLRALCGQLGLALSRARSFEQQRTVAVTLQRSILGPATLPAGFAARYEPAHSPLEVGGDWYDVVELADGCIGLIVGDCVGRGLAAATVMGQLRSACRALLLQHDGPATALTALDGFACLLDGAVCTTVLCARLDPATGELRYSSAGHPPAVLADPAGGHALLDAATSVPLAVKGGEPRREAVTRVAPGATLLLYTDGLVERRGEPIDAGIATAARAVAAGRRVPPEALADRVLDASGRRGGDDDVVVLVYRHDTPSASRYARSFPADPAELSTARVALTSWLDAHGLDRDATERAVLAAGEAWTNAIEHGYRLDRTRTVHTTVRVAGTELTITVADLGRWRPPGDPGTRGRGIPLMEGVCDRVSVDHGPDGTTVDLAIDLV